MTFDDVLSDLLANLRTAKQPVLISWDEVQQFPDNALDSLVELELLKPAPPAQSLECYGCDKHCFMDVIALPHNEPAKYRSFIVCDDAEMQSQIGRIKINPERLKQWQASVKQLAIVIADLLGLNHKIIVDDKHVLIKLGMLPSDKGRRWVMLNSATLSLAINNYPLPVEGVLFFDNEQLVIDHDAINDLLNREPLNQGKAYAPSTDKRESRKLATQGMYQDWNDEYLKLKKQHPTQSKSWCSTKIAKMAVSQDRDAGTIRRNLN